MSDFYNIQNYNILLNRYTVDNPVEKIIKNWSGDTLFHLFLYLIRINNKENEDYNTKEEIIYFLRNELQNRVIEHDAKLLKID